MGRIRPRQLRLNYLLIFVAYCAIVLALLRPIPDLEPMFRAWYLTLIVVTVPWTTLAFVRALMQPGLLRDRASLTLKWLPAGLVFGLMLLQKPLDLDPEFGMTPPLCFCELVIPSMIVLAIARARRRDRREL